MQFDLTILGSNGAVPAYNRHPSAQIVGYNGRNFLVDCGEGTQFRMIENNIRRGKLDHIFISHLHGDHYFGLTGLITSFNLNNREHPLHLYGPPGLDEILALTLKVSSTQLRFEICFHPTQSEEPELIFEDDTLSVTSFPLIHRIPTTGFLFREHPKLRRVNPEAILRHGLNTEQIITAKKGGEVWNHGKLIPLEEITLPAAKPRSYAYCSDTAYSELLPGILKGVDLLYHEATFMEAHGTRASETLHSTARQAALTALHSEAGKLLLGHFSARYADLQPLLDEARIVFPETYLGEERQVFKIENVILTPSA